MREAILILLVAVTAAAQSVDPWRFYKDPKGGGAEAIHPGPDHRDNGITVCRLRFASSRSEAGSSGWPTDYPKASSNLAMRLPEITTAHVDGRQSYWVVDVGSPGLFLCPLVLVSDMGTMTLSPHEARNLRDYLAKGGLVWSDDTWASVAWNQMSEVMATVAPGAVVVTPGFDHPVYRMQYRIAKTLQMASFEHWMGYHSWSGRGHVSERGPFSPETPLRLLVDGDHVAMIITHNTDVLDGVQREGDSHAFFEVFAGDSYAHAVNVVLFATTH